MTNQKPEFLQLFYKIFAGFGFGFTLLILILGGWSRGLNFLLGFASIALIIILWHISLHYSLGPRKASWAMESLLVFMRYILLGGLFYAMISLFAVSWIWYCAGTTTILPGLLVATLMYDRQSPPPQD